MKVLLDTSVGITNYLDSYYKVKIIGTNDSSVTKDIFLKYTKVHQKSQRFAQIMTRSCSNT